MNHKINKPASSAGSKGKGQVEVKVEVSAEELKPFLEKAVNRLAKEIKVDGFRPGNVPSDIVRKKIGELELLQEAANDIVVNTFSEVIKKEKLETVGSPDIKIEKIAPGNDFVYLATVSLMPEVKLTDYSALKISKEKADVDEKEFNRVLGDLQNMRVKEKEVDRKAKQGDKVEIDFNISRDKVPMDGGSAKKLPIVIGDKKMIPGFEDKLIGLKANDEKEFELTFPDDYHEKTLAGKPAEFKVKVLKVYERELPKLDDGFAKQMGRKDLEDLKNQLRENLLKEKKTEIDQKSEKEMLEKIIEKSSFGEVPDILVSSEVETMIREFEQNITAQGMKFEDYLNNIKKTLGDLKLDLTSQALKRVKISLVIRAIADQKKIETSDSEIKEEINNTLKAYPGNKQVEENMKSEGYREHLKHFLRSKKTIEMLRKEIIK